MALVASAYYARRSTRRPVGNVGDHRAQPPEDPPESKVRRLEPSMMAREEAPLCPALAGYDPVGILVRKHRSFDGYGWWA